MPYITPRARKLLMTTSVPPATPGELVYVLTNTLNQYAMTQGLRFQVIAEVLGALDATRSEFYRRVVVPFEDAKCIENGDVYPAELLPRKDQ